jgi:RND family efflux transporter MFP subunit
MVLLFFPVLSGAGGESTFATERPQGVAVHGRHKFLANAVLTTERSEADALGTSPGVVASLPGIAQPSRRAVLSAPHEGILMEILVTEGDSVESGDVLARMDNRVAQAEVRLAETIRDRTAAISRARYELELAENVLNRLTAANTQLAVSELEIDQARSRRDQAEAVLAQAEEQAVEARFQLELAQARLESHNLRAPFPGIVVRIDGRAGESVTESDDLIVLANLQTLRAEVYLPTQWFGRLHVGDHCQLAAGLPVERRLPATVVTCEPLIDSGTQTFRCAFEVDNSALQLPAGFAVWLVTPNMP